MTKIDPFAYKLNVKTNAEDRLTGSTILVHEQHLIQPSYVNRLKPCFIRLAQRKKLNFAGFKLLRKEPFLSKTRIFKGLTDKSIPQKISTKLTGVPPEFRLTHTPNSRKQPYFGVVWSLAFHGIIVLLIMWATTVKLSPGNSTQGKPVDVVFLPTKTGRSGMTGPGLDGQKAQPILQQTSPPAELPRASAAPSAPEPSSEDTSDIPLQNGMEALSIPKYQPKKTNKNPTKSRNYTYHYNSHQPSHNPSRTSQKSPFETMTNLDFSDNPRKSKRQMASRKYTQGSNSSIDLSTGPLVKNGKINVPYATKINIKGVTDDYGELVANWIHNHMYYPIEAAEKGQDGSPSVHVVLNKDGKVTSIALTSSSGSDALDAAIVGMFRDATLPKIPPDLPDHFDLDLTINYILLRR
ncbi:hypothetical protein COMNV_01032 [Commensalibacter sp. Nvir]|uniref:energy transducer TonB n=1 Tax=Commensalibacter sp. Nvir TaxID=3069817 RepID=UPI002D388FCC|nr:hypothetical protein COMNV_01032 [Commensalibacter sp. Nvir]